MRFTIRERIILLDVLPATGNSATLRLQRKLREALSFSEEENLQCKIVQTGNQIVWDEAEAAESEPKEIAVGPTMYGVIKAKFEELDKTEKLPEMYLDVFDRWMAMKVEEAQVVEQPKAVE